MKKTLVALVVAAVMLGGVGVAWSATSGGGTSSGSAATLDASTTGGRRPALRRAIARLAVKTAADTIHVDQKALVQELRSGKSIADVANEHGVSPATVSDAIVKAAEQKLQTLQSTGKLTADQVQKIEQRLPQAVDKLVDAHRGQHAPAATNGDSPAQQSSLAA